MARFKLSNFKNKHFLALAGNAVIAVFAILMMAILFRSLGKTDVGLWFFFLTIYNLGDAVRSGFLGTATIKFYAGTTRERGQEVLGSVWYLATIITALLVLLDVLSLPLLHFVTNDGLVLAIKWFGVTFISSLPFNLIFWILVAEERYDKILWLRMINSVSMILYIIVLVFLHKMTLEALMWCNLLTNCLTSAVGMLWGFSKIGTLAKRTNECTGELVRFGKYSLGSTAASKLLNSTDNFVISFFLGPAALAVYSIPIKLMEIVEFPLRSFVGTGMSAMANAFNNDNLPQTRHIMKKYSGMLIMAFIPLTLGTLIFADVAVGLLGGGQYKGTEAANIFRIFMVLALVYPIDRFIGVTLDIIHKPKINFQKVLIMLAFAVIGDLGGVLIFKNLYGIAIGSYLTIYSGVIFGYVQLNRHLEIPAKDIITTGFNETRMFLKDKLFGKK